MSGLGPDKDPRGSDQVTESRPTLVAPMKSLRQRRPASVPDQALPTRVQVPGTGPQAHRNGICAGPRSRPRHPRARVSIRQRARQGKRAGSCGRNDSPRKRGIAPAFSSGGKTACQAGRTTPPNVHVVGPVLPEPVPEPVPGNSRSRDPGSWERRDKTAAFPQPGSGSGSGRDRRKTSPHRALEVTPPAPTRICA